MPSLVSCALRDLPYLFTPALLRARLTRFFPASFPLLTRLLPLETVHPTLPASPTISGPISGNSTFDNA
jgi:hypothetical protein